MKDKREIKIPLPYNDDGTPFEMGQYIEILQSREAELYAEIGEIQDEISAVVQMRDRIGALALALYEQRKREMGK